MKKHIHSAAMHSLFINLVTLMGIVWKELYSKEALIITFIGLSIYHLVIFKQLSDKIYDQFFDQDQK